MSSGLASPVFLRAFSLADEGSYGDAVLRGVAGVGLSCTEDGTTSRSRGPILPEACYRISLPSNQRVQGMPGARCTRGLACKMHKKMRTRAYRFSGGIRHSLRNGFTTYSVLSSAIGFVVTVTWRMIPQSLTPASGRQDHTTSSSASHAVRQKRIRGHRIPSRACDDRETPLVSGQDQIAILLIWARRQVKFG
jgi:hypothetical protein